MTQIIRNEQDDVEFFTIAATGESGMSQSGLAILCGVDRSVISKLEKTLVQESPSEWLKDWVGMPLTLVQSSEYKNATIYQSHYCADVIQHYAFKGNKVAQTSLTRFASLGINTWIQTITQWDSTPVDLHNIINTAQKFLTQYLERQDAIEVRQTHIEERTDNLEQLVHQHDNEVDRIFHPDGKYFSVRAWAKRNQIRVSKQEAANLGRQATKLSKQLGIDIDKLEDPRYGEVNIYHEVILRQVFEMEVTKNHKKFFPVEAKKIQPRPVAPDALEHLHQLIEKCQHLPPNSADFLPSPSAPSSSASY
jgi:hypothetical protein